MGVFQRLALFCHFVLRTIVYGIRLPGSIVERRTRPPDSPSSPPYLAHPWSSTHLSHFISAPRLPAPQRTFTRGRCCVRMVFAVETFRGGCLHHAMRDTTVQGEGVPESSEHRRHLRHQHRGFFRLRGSTFSELGPSQRRGLLPRRRRQG